MSYPTNDIRYDFPLYIRELQLRLRDLSYVHPSIPRVEIDGIFGPETAAAVSAAQRLFSLPPSGVADLPTWTAITAAQRTVETLRIPLSAAIFPHVLTVLRLGDSGETVAIIQHMFRALARLDTGFETIAVDGTIDAATVRNILHLQRLGGLPPTGEMDVATWNTLARLYNTIH